MRSAAALNRLVSPSPPRGEDHATSGHGRAERPTPRLGWRVGAWILSALVAAAVLGPFVVADPLAIAPARRLAAPGATHWFGTDHLGRDLFARTFFGARVSLFVGFGAAAAALAGGLILGLACGLTRILDEAITRFLDLLSTFPSILLAIALLTILPGGVATIIAVIAIADLPRTARLARSTLLSVRALPYIDAARGAGTPPLQILSRHIAPAAWPPLAVLSAYLCASAILAEAGLSFLGAGTPPEIPSWGNMIAAGARYFIVAPWLILIPGAALALTTLSVTLLADGLRDRLDSRQEHLR